MGDDLAILLKLTLTKGVGYKKARQLLAQRSPSDLLIENDQGLRGLGFTQAQIQSFRSVDERMVDKILTWSTQPNQWIINLYDPLFPPLLKQIPSSPLLLFVKGNPLLLAQPQIAIVGSRDASKDGQRNAYQFAQQIVAHNYVVTSGLALGIDSFAHQGALDSSGNTIAVLGSGLEVIYPKQNKRLSDQIIEQGALVSEFLPYVSPKAAHFPQRNRIVSGLSLGVLVVEATQRSGSLITARYGLEQGREVFAIPGGIDSGKSNGCHDLIRSGAKLVDKVSDIFEELSSLNSYLSQQSFLYNLFEIQKNNKRSLEPVSPLNLTDKLDSVDPVKIANNIVDNSDDFDNNVQEKRLDKVQHNLIERQEKLPYHINEECDRILQYVEWQVTSIDVIVTLSQEPIWKVMQSLLELELLGVIANVSGGYMRVKGIIK